MPPRRLRLIVVLLALASPALLTVPGMHPSVPSAAAAGSGLSFGPAQPADPQRDEGEPNIEIGADGRIYTCGPTGFTTGADYAQVSTDGGDQFHLLGLAPRGQLSDRGGGDCYLATSKKKGANGNYTLSYVGLADTDFATARSTDNGASFLARPTDCAGATDRQWTTFIDDKTVFLLYNDLVQGLPVVQKSTDGGYTWTGYGPCGPASEKAVAPAATYNGPLKADTNGAHNTTHPGTPLLYAGYNLDNEVHLALTTDAGNKWQDCLVAKTQYDPSNGFVVVDHDSLGNLFISWGEKDPDHAAFHVKMSWLPISKLAQCKNVDVNPGWSTPVQVDAPPSQTIVFPWLVASGAPGRVAVAWYGSPEKGIADSGDFKGPWQVFVAQTLDARAAKPTFEQVIATTRPMHYDQVCLSGLACTTGGDRSLADFFAITVDPTTGRLVIVFDEDGKVPDTKSGPVAIANVLVQNTGASNLGGTVSTRRAVVRTSSADPVGDAQSPYSTSNIALPFTPKPASRTNQPALDLTSVSVGPEVNPTTGAPVADGGFTLTLKVKDLSNAALNSALSKTHAQSLIWAFRWINGYQPADLAIHWDPVTGFGGGFDDFATGSATCLSVPSVNGYEAKCLTYPGTHAVPMKVDQASGTIRISAPRSVLKALGPVDDFARPTLVAGNHAGVSRFYSGAAFTMANVLLNQTQSWLTPVDGAAAFDFLLPSSPHAPGGNNRGPNGGPSNGDRSGGGSLATTGLPIVLPIIALVVSVCATAVARLRRRHLPR